MMSDSRGDLPASGGADEQTETRQAASSDRKAPRTKRARRQSAPRDSLETGNKVRVRIDAAHALGDAPPPAASTTDDTAAAPSAEPSGEPPLDSPQAPPAADSPALDSVSELAGSQAGADVESQAASPAQLESISIDKLQQMQLQFEQLAGHLRAQQYELDRREAQFNSQLAQQENELRTSRLWFRERQQELADREAEFEQRRQREEAAQLERLTEREAEIARREEELESQRAAIVKSLSHREAELARREADFDLQAVAWSKDRAEWIDAQARFEAECNEAKQKWQEQADALVLKHRELELERQALVVQSSAEQGAERRATVEQAPEREFAEVQRVHRELQSTLDSLRQLLSGEPPSSEASNNGSYEPSDLEHLASEFRTAIARLQARQKNLEEAEALLSDGQSALDRGRQQLTADRQTWQEQCDIERRRLGDDRRRCEADLDKKLRAIADRSGHLERRSAAVDQLRAEVLRAQRETLELRLATDEIWAQLAGSVPPPVLTQSLARIRGKLAEQYQLERAELADQQKQLEALAVRLEAQHDKLQNQKQALERWVTDRRNEIEGQASRLVTQELEIARRQAELEEINERQESERRLYEGEIRRLLGELRSARPTMAAA